MAKRYPKRKLSSEDISIALNFDSDSDDSNDKLEKLLGEDSGSDLEFTLNRPRKSYISDSDSGRESISTNDCMIMCYSCEKPATHFCKTCDQNLCKFCIIDHYRNTNFTKNHDMILL